MRVSRAAGKPRPRSTAPQNVADREKQTLLRALRAFLQNSGATATELALALRCDYGRANALCAGAIPTENERVAITKFMESGG